VLANFGSFVCIFGMLWLLGFFFVFLFVFELLLFALVVINDDALVFVRSLKLRA
jgi:hypothetical protein